MMSVQRVEDTLVFETIGAVGRSEATLCAAVGASGAGDAALVSIDAPGVPTGPIDAGVADGASGNGEARGPVDGVTVA